MGVVHLVVHTPELFSSDTPGAMVEGQEVVEQRTRQGRDMMVVRLKQMKREFN